ncbi:hypothetical protein Tco_0606848 [Tanacetum coccineum]
MGTERAHDHRQNFAPIRLLSTEYIRNHKETVKTRKHVQESEEYKKPKPGNTSLNLLSQKNQSHRRTFSPLASISEAVNHRIGDYSQIKGIMMLLSSQRHVVNGENTINSAVFIANTLRGTRTTVHHQRNASLANPQGVLQIQSQRPTQLDQRLKEYGKQRLNEREMRDKRARIFKTGYYSTLTNSHTHTFSDTFADWSYSFGRRQTGQGSQGLNS